MSRKRPTIDRDYFKEELVGLRDITSEPPRQVALEKIKPRGLQPRRQFDTAALDALAASIDEIGLLEPLVVRHLGDGYEIVAGERRYRALKKLGWLEAPVVVLDLNDKEAELAAAIENLNREDLSPIDELDAVLNVVSTRLDKSRDEVVQLITQARSAELGDLSKANDDVMHVQTLMQKLGYTNLNSFYANRLSLVKLPVELGEAIRAGEMPYSVAKVLARMKGDRARSELLEEVRRGDLSLREVQERVKARLEEERRPPPALYLAFNEVKRGVTRSWVQELGSAKEKRFRQLIRELEKLLSG